MAKKKSAGRGGKRAGAGRPKSIEGDPVQLTVRVPQETADKLQNKAEAAELTRAEYARQVLIEDANSE